MSDSWPEKIDGGLVTTIDREMEAVPVLAAWPEDERFIKADQVERVAKLLIAAFHKEITNARIAYLFREKMARRGGSVWGTAEKVAGKWRMLAEYDFVVTMNWDVWRGLGYPARAALLDHELEHCGMDDHGSFQLLPHDLEEFNSIVARWGPWRASVVNFGHVLAPQLDLALQK